MRTPVRSPNHSRGNNRAAAAHGWRRRGSSRGRMRSVFPRPGPNSGAATPRIGWHQNAGTDSFRDHCGTETGLAAERSYADVFLQNVRRARGPLSRPGSRVTGLSCRPSRSTEGRHRWSNAFGRRPFVTDDERAPAFCRVLSAAAGGQVKSARRHAGRCHLLPAVSPTMPNSQA